MLLLFVSLLVIFIGSTLMYVFSEYPSYVLISLGNWTLEFRLWFGLTALVIFLFIFTLIYKRVRKIIGSLAGSVSWIKESRGKRAERRTYAGLIHFVEGNWQAAKKELVSAAKDTDKPLVHYLAAAKSAYQLGLSEETNFLLQEAKKNAPDNEFAVALSQANIYFSDKEYEKSLATINSVREQALRHPVALDLLRDLYIQLKDWPALITILPEIKKHSSLKLEEFDILEENVYMSLLDASAHKESNQSDSDKDGNKESNKNSEALDTTWQELPKPIKKKIKLIGLYANLLHRCKKDDEAGQLISKTLKSQWHSGLVELYGKLNMTDRKAQLTSAEGWLKKHGEDASLYFSLGKLCIKNSLWGKAKSYFEQSLKIKERPTVYAELGALFGQLGEHQKSASMYQKGLLLKTLS
ncbi:heme biosynthesis HemY N-terminal domain-containing protein [Agarilytica rhodophyticola]|uniref:heme biosynthesis HemY N-terminal domain-containing protein n=1 Tax=Agarilytica rhodophyticola TaxID=1737490 RepID=UPI000B3496EA|nr:heme biosynthesis HemY N-terminal domain-containing protein [Agarilytica rhodophyticola]